VITHADNDMISAYAHLKEINVAKGDTVEQGETIGSVGRTGSVKKPQLHFELRQKGKTSQTVDPEKLLQ
jgi:murein DD-endopeptidase MepM/ murein hydrolase activator NlpD